MGPEKRNTDMEKTLTGNIRLWLRGHKDNAAIGKRLDGPNGAPVLHAEFFWARVLEADDKGRLHSYDFPIETDFAELLANGNAMNVFDITVDIGFVKDARGNLVEDIFVSGGKMGTIHHKCILKAYECVKQRPVPQNHPYCYCLDDAKPTKRDDDETSPVDRTEGVLG